MNDPLSILVVDDDAGVRIGTARLLEKAGYRVDQAADGKAALQAIRQRRPDLLLLDRDMPGLDGLEVCRRIKQDPGSADMAIIMVSGVYPESSHQAEGLELGVDDYIARPIENRELLARVQAHVRILSLTRTLQSKVKEVEMANAVAIRDALAALNLLEDAVAARDQMNAANRQLQLEIGERKRGEEALRENEAKFRMLFQNNRAILGLSVEKDSRYIDVNEEFLSVTGYSREEVIGRTALDMGIWVDPKDRSLLVDELRKNSRVRDLDLQIRTKSGEVRTLLCNIERFDFEGEPCLLLSAIDITERKLAAEELAERLRIETLVADLAACFVAVDAAHADSEIEDALRRICEELDLDMGNVWASPEDDPDTLVLQYMYRGNEGPPLPDAMDARDCFPWVLDQLRVTGATVSVGDLAALPSEAARDKEAYVRFGVTSSINVPMYATDGRLVGVLTFSINDGRAIPEASTSRIEMFSHIIFDLLSRVRGERALAASLEERESLHAQFVQAQKMEAVGTLAGGVAHDFNNLLQAMMTQVQLLKLLKADPARVEGVIGEMEQQALYGASLTRQLLLFSRRETATPELLDLGRVVQNSAGMLHRLLREDIAFSVDCSSERLMVMSDPGQLQQLMVNLVVNASHAMPHGGTLAIRAFPKGPDLATLEVEDSGHGIPEEIRSRIFEPLFTTKSAEQGTGLGLAVVHGIVTGNGGAIEVESQVGKGTTFRVLLPRREDSDPESYRGDGDWTGDLQRGHGERILLVEDEKAAREGLLEILTALGYQVTAVGSAEDAGLLPAEPVFELLFTDLVLPGAHGPELAQFLVERWPGLKVIFMSGHTEDHAVRRGAADGTLRFLQKPFDMDTLAREIRAALTES